MILRFGLAMIRAIIAALSPAASQATSSPGSASGFVSNLMPQPSQLSAKEDTWRFAAKRCALAVAFLIVVTFAGRNSLAQANYQPSPENLKARQEFQNAKFGMFIHWGVYSVLGSGEWVFHDRALTVDEYNRLPLFFDPENFDAKTWVALAKAAGMKYITITSRHHDGFAMFNSKVSDWNIVQ